jgi:hypothetical protein
LWRRRSHNFDMLACPVLLGPGPFGPRTHLRFGNHFGSTLVGRKRLILMMSLPRLDDSSLQIDIRLLITWKVLLRGYLRQPDLRRLLLMEHALTSFLCWITMKQQHFIKKLIFPTSFELLAFERGSKTLLAGS